MRSTKKILWALLFAMPFLFGTTVFGDEIDDTIPNVTARVARISFIRGDVQVRRDGSQDWEKAVLNLPVVEGDEITTGADGRFEIQFNTYTHVRAAENLYLKIVGLKDGAIALSLPEGTLNVRLTKFDKDTAFFEVDAPKTTIAVQKSGMYRIDAGKQGDSEVRVSVTNNGEARVYADNSGFTLKNGRTANIKIDGQFAGEWDTEDADRYADEFDTWTLDRDVTIAKRLKDAYYDKYYDQDIYGAEDLNDSGDWIHTKKYGYVWRPYRNATSQYANWSPYRYGNWRWVPPYGWTWVNDEPWGWATYHHGRWFYDDGTWYWTPYGYYRRSRSWWSPALVGLTIIRQTICWYPLPYHYGYYNYNYYYGNYGGGNHGGNHNGGGHNGGGHNGGGNGGGATPTPTPVMPTSYPQGGTSVFATREQRLAWFATPPLLRIPPTGVVSTPLSSFGRGSKAIGTASTSDARAVLTKTLTLDDPVRMLPTFRDLDGKVSSDIRGEKPRSLSASTKPQTGILIRDSDGPMDQKLQTTRVFGDRKPVQQIKAAPDNSNGPRKTGAVTRQVFTNDPQNTPIRAEPTRETRTPKQRSDDPIRAEPTTRDGRQSEPVKQPRTDAPPKQRDDPVRQPRSDPPTRSEPPPRNDPPTRSEPPPRNDPPSRNDPPPRNDSPPKSEPTKSEPSEQRKPKDG
ncbi:MAG: DUF6600 domain-containing protein [Pyrinomonadaceae bacterium]